MKFLSIQLVQARLYIGAGIVLASVAAILLIGLAAPLYAQGETIQWSRPVNLSATIGGSISSNLVADKYGRLHVFWSGGNFAGGLPGQSDGQTTTNIPPGNTLYYRYWNGQAWSKPVDLFFTNGPYYNLPVAATDNTDTIHLVWVAYEGIHYSSASLLSSLDARAWRRDTLIANGAGDRPSLVADKNGTLHLVYAAWTDASHAPDGNVYYMTSTDHGNNWSTPLQVSQIGKGEQTFGYYDRLVIDSNGILHLVWSEAQGPSYVGRTMMYARSTDHGKSWSAPLRLAWGPTDKSRNDAPEMVSPGPNEVMITYVCGEGAGRCFLYSKDAGRSWSPSQHVFGDLLALSAWDGMTVDSQGKIYWIMQLRNPPAMYYSIWDGNQWQSPPVPFLTQPPLDVANGPVPVISEGNKLNLVVYSGVTGEVWYTRGIIQAPFESPPVIPTATPVPTATATPTLTPSPTPRIVIPTVAPTVVAETAPGTDAGGSSALLLGVIPVILLVLVLVAIGLLRRAMGR
ncbi:MAG: sialidase family protein [Anaerolineae bacterium]